MKKLFSTTYSAGAFNVAMLLLRVGFGVLLLPHGYDKLVHFATMKTHSLNFLGIGQGPSLALNIFAEFFCSMLLILGLFTRLAVIPLIINMSVVVALAHNYDFFGDAEHGAMYLVGFLVILLVGPGKISVDGVINK
ncbi:MAG TPA: DoxX family protein [Flavitalea sp.]|nr:DoxX family protein [Flavitalea sp.]